MRRGQRRHLSEDPDQIWGRPGKDSKSSLEGKRRDVFLRLSGETLEADGRLQGPGRERAGNATPGPRLCRHRGTGILERIRRDKEGGLIGPSRRTC